MFICICNAIRETELREVARQASGDAALVYASMGKAPQCCQCLDDADDILNEVRETGLERELEAA